jgi:hypothetical protein
MGSGLATARYLLRDLVSRAVPTLREVVAVIFWSLLLAAVLLPVMVRWGLPALLHAQAVQQRFYERVDK